MAIFAGLLLVPAGTVDWWRAWVYLAVMVLIVIATCAWLYVHSKGLLEVLPTRGASGLHPYYPRCTL
jgi:hypothetical protein